MQEICNKCGLPNDLCVCESISKESQKITIETERKRFRKYITIIKGIDSTQINIQDLIKKIKSKLACGGTIKNNKIILQGQHEKEIKDILIDFGFTKSQIE
jgi:translation initiation factor 1